MSKEKTVKVNVRLASLFVLIPVLILMGRKIYVDIRDERRGIAYQYRSALQEAFNKGLPYFRSTATMASCAPLLPRCASGGTARYPRKESTACESGCST